MKTNKKIIITVVVIIAIIVIGILIGTIKTSTHDNPIDDTEKIDVTKVEFTDTDINMAKDYMNSFTQVVLRKTESKNIITTEPEYNSDFNVIQEIYSEIDLSKMTDLTVNSDDYLSMENPEDMNLLNFEQEFGFNWRGYDNIFDISLALVQAQGFSMDLENSTLDEETYNAYGQRVYILNDNSAVVNKIIDKLDYDEILDSKCTYRLSGSGEESFIGYINACVQYKKDGQTIFYNLCFQIALPESELGCGCGCNPTDDAQCSCGECEEDSDTNLNYE